MTQTMNARQKTARLHAQYFDLTWEECWQLRRASLTLSRWAELECGDSNDYASWAIERDETTNIPYIMVRYPHTSNQTSKRRVADRETGALRRIAAICKRHDLYFYHQTDPRGCALYIHSQPLTESNYNTGIAVF